MSQYATYGNLMRLEWIDDILAVHDTGSLRAAADIRFLTASAFTRRIKAVEEALGGELFDRNNKPLTLRPHVLEAIPELRDAAASLRGIQSQLGALKGQQKRTRLICQHTLSVLWAPKVTRVLSETGKSVRVRSGSRDECLLSIIKSDADVAIVYEEPDTVTAEANDLFDRMLLGQEEFMPVMAAGGADKLARAIEAQQIPLVTYPRNLFLGEVLERVLSTRPLKDMKVTTVAESGLGPAVLEFVREGIGVGWLPTSMITNELEDGEFKAATDIFPSFDLNIVALKSNRERTKSGAVVWREIQENFIPG
ncbi:MAG: LysR family transcriptional regulator [Octadecabacter sp.]|nr:LysR family transcriptional regulator [Octadecabacter sp.]